MKMVLLLRGSWTLPFMSRKAGKEKLLLRGSWTLKISPLNPSLLPRKAALL